MTNPEAEETEQAAGRPGPAADAGKTDAGRAVGAKDAGRAAADSAGPEKPGRNEPAEDAEQTEQAVHAEQAESTRQGEKGTERSGSTGQTDCTEDAGQADAQASHRLEQAVRAAEQALIEFEIAVETFRIEVENFSRLHHQRLGPMYTRLDELDALIAEAIASRTGDQEDLRRAREMRALVLPMPGVDELFHGWMGSDGLSPEATAMLTDRPVRPPHRVRPDEEVRRIYRDLVRRTHPDLARDETEKKRRDAFIARVNEAYAAGDRELLEALALEWSAGPPPVAEPPSPNEELYARLEWLAERKEMLAAAAAELEESAIGAMLKMAPDDPDGLLDEIADQLLAEVARREARLAELVE